MRKKIVAGNWKMNKTYEDAKSLINEIVQKVKEDDNNERLIVLAPPFPYLTDACKLTSEIKTIKIAAQNCYSEEKGAFTGEVSAQMLLSIGAEYVIIGHSERRNYFNESDEFLLNKVNIVLKNGLKPIFCCGEKLADRDKGEHFNIINAQLKNTVFNLPLQDFENIVIAYEPVWAIGTGVNATPKQAQEMHNYIRKIIEENYNPYIASETTILYGGSCNAKNAKELFSNPDVDGGLIGGASLNADEFIAIANSF